MVTTKQTMLMKRILLFASAALLFAGCAKENLIPTDENGNNSQKGDITLSFSASQGRDIDIIKLNGSIELAPILGLSDVIVDIVETGTTLRENDLKVITEFMPISARFIANRASYQFKHREIENLLGKLTEVTER